MPAAPTIRPYYDPAYDAGTPAIVSFWAAFLGERSEMNKAEMKRRVALMDPSSRRKEAQALRNNIADLERAKVQAVAKGQDSLDDFFRTLGNVIVADTNAAAGIEEKKLDVRGKAEAQRKDQEEARREEFTPQKKASYDALDQSFVDARSPDATARGTGTDEYMSGVREAIDRESVDKGSSKARHLAYLAIQQAGLHGDKAAVDALQGEFFPGEDPDAWMAEKRALVDPKAWDKRMNEVIGGAGAGGGSRTFLEAIDALGLTPDKDQSGGGTFGVERGTTTRGGRGPGLGQPIDTSSTDAIIDMYKKQLEALTNPSSSGNQFAGYRSNYLLETPFQTSAPALEETLRAMNEMSPTERSLLMDSLRQTGGRAEPAAQYRRDNFTGPQNGPLVAIADTGGDAYDWLQKSLRDALAKAGSRNEATAEQGQTDLWAVARGWGNLPPSMQNAFPGLGEAVASGNIEAIRRIQGLAWKAAVEGGGPHVGQWLADQATLVSRISDPEERAFRASQLYETASNLPREMAGDVSGTIMQVYEESSRAGNINLLDGGFKAIGTETQKTRDRQSRDFTSDVSENAGEVRSSETEARLSALSRESREAATRIRALRGSDEWSQAPGELDVELTKLENQIVSAGAERDFLLNPNDARAALRWAGVQRQRGDTAEAVATEAALATPESRLSAMTGTVDMPTGPGSVKEAPGPAKGQDFEFKTSTRDIIVEPTLSILPEEKLALPEAEAGPLVSGASSLNSLNVRAVRLSNEMSREYGAKLMTEDRATALKTAADRAAKMMRSRLLSDKTDGAKLYGEAISELYLSGVQPEDATGASYFMAQYAKSLEDEAVAEPESDASRKKAAKALLVKQAAKDVLAGPRAPALSFEPTEPSAADEWAP